MSTRNNKRTLKQSTLFHWTASSSSSSSPNNKNDSSNKRPKIGSSGNVDTTNKNREHEEPTQQDHEHESESESEATPTKSSIESSNSVTTTTTTTESQPQASQQQQQQKQKRYQSDMWINESGAHVEYIANFMSPRDASHLFHQLLDPARSYNFQRHLMTMAAGKKVLSPRTGILFGARVGSKTHHEYFSRSSYDWTPEMLQLKKQVEEYMWQRYGERHNFDFALVNRYDSGEEYIGWHSDREVHGTPIASISLGAERNFKFREIATGKTVVSRDLRHGSLVLMKGTTQELFQHCLAKTSKTKGQRLNITFRYEPKQPHAKR